MGYTHIAEKECFIKELKLSKILAKCCSFIIFSLRILALFCFGSTTTFPTLPVDFDN